MTVSLLLCHLCDIHINIEYETSFLGLVKVFVVGNRRSAEQSEQLNTDLQQMQVTEPHQDQLHVRMCETIITKINFCVDNY